MCFLPNKKQIPRYLSILLILLSGLIFNSQYTYSQTQTTEVVTEKNDENISIDEEIKEECCAQFDELAIRIVELHQRRAQLLKELKTAVGDEAKDNLTKRISQLETQENDLKNLFEKNSLGGLDPAQLASSFDEKEAPYDWQAELLQIVQPVFTEMQRMTEGPRKRERLRAEFNENEKRLALLKDGLAHLTSLPPDKLSKLSKTHLDNLENNWRIYYEDLVRRQDIVRLQLEGLEDSTDFITKLKNNLIEFAKGRGLVLAISFSTFFGILYILSKAMNFLIDRRDRLGKMRRVNIKWRLLVLFYRLFSFLFALIAFLVVLHSLGDMVLFGLAILIIIASLLSFRTYIPRYLAELRIYLNFGSARQGERVIYNGIPWRIERINLYSAYLVNPALDNGRIRLTVTLLGNLVSRPIQFDEIWFPSKVGESFLLPDGTFVEILRQTPESMYLESFNSHIIYPTSDFIAAKPKNLSMGFYTVVDFGLSYKHFETPIDEVFAKIKQAVLDKFEGTDLEEGYNSISIEFRRINEGMSLLYTVIISMKGSSAGYYYQASRMVQEACLRCAQKHNWEMPFTQIQIHQDSSKPLPPSVQVIPKVAN